MTLLTQQQKEQTCSLISSAIIASQEQMDRKHRELASGIVNEALLKLESSLKSALDKEFERINSEILSCREENTRLHNEVQSLKNQLCAKEIELVELRTEKGKEFDKLTKKIEDLKNDAPNSSNCTFSYASVVKTLGAKQDSVLNQLNVNAQEMQDRVRRESNLLIVGVKASLKSDVKERERDDKIEVDNIMQKLEVRPNINGFRRFKGKDGSLNGPILLTLDSKTTRNSVLKVSSQLRKIKGYEKVFIRPDETEAQRRFSQELRKECKRLNEEKANDPTQKIQPFYYGIRGGRVRPVYALQ